MIRKILLAQLVMSLLLVACTQKQGSVYAKITERKHLVGDKLMISYSFINQGKLYNGSTTINNIVIPKDSVLVNFSPENPGDNKLQIP